MKYTNYFTFIHNRKDRKEIKLEWIEFVINNPCKVEQQPDGRYRYWAKINEVGNKFLRVILLEDKETIHNVFFDRTFKED